jgi:PAS domain S-box-containing protein
MRKTIHESFPFKTIISVLFGFLGFAINFHTINFAFPPYTATVLIGLIFPILITFAWGWKYGLLSALVGGCQSMWWIWGPSNGYATFLVVPPFTLWIVWHGFMADFRNKQTVSKWWLSAYVVEVPFRILNSINLFTLSRWAISLNPPSWAWASNAPDMIPIDFSIFVVIKQAVVGYIILLLADVLLNLGFVRKFFRLEKEYNQANTNFIISAAFLVGVFFWIIDSTINTLVFQPESSFLDSLALNVSSHDIYTRTVFLLVSLAGGVLASNLLRGQRESDNALRDSEDRFKLIFEQAPDGYYLSDVKGIFLEGNLAVERIIGYTREDLIGSSFFRNGWLSAGQVPKAAKLLLQNIEGHSTGPDEFILTCKDGTKLPVEVNAHPVKIQGEQVILGIVRDITDRKKAEREIQERMNELETFYRATLGREDRVIELKQEVNKLLEQLGKNKKYREYSK